LPGWPQTVIRLISDFQVARITGVSHRHPALSLSLSFCWVVLGFEFRASYLLNRSSTASAMPSFLVVSFSMNVVK
jgi:hypothetical protein